MFQGWCICHFCGQSVPVFYHPHELHNSVWTIWQHISPMRKDLGKISSIFTHLQFSGIFLPNIRNLFCGLKFCPNPLQVAKPSLTSAPGTWAAGTGVRLPSAIEWLILILLSLNHLHIVKGIQITKACQIFWALSTSGVTKTQSLPFRGSHGYYWSWGSLRNRPALAEWAARHTSF